MATAPLIAETLPSLPTEYDDAETAAAVKKLDRVLDRLNEGLADTLDDHYNAADPDTKARLLEQ